MLNPDSKVRARTPHEGVSRTRHLLRQRMLKLRGELSPEDRARAHQAIQSAILQRWQDSWRTVLLYVNRTDEAATMPIILEAMQRGLRVCVPAFDPGQNAYVPSELKDLERDLFTGRFGILEPKPEACRPVPAEELDVAFVPGVAFDRAGNRLGFGYGFFDKMIRTCRALKIGLAYQFQLVDEIKVHGGDVPMDWVITDREVIECPKR